LPGRRGGWGQLREAQSLLTFADRSFNLQLR
jgi:hypothetical protein